jgi:carboxypeptidase PM20D1
LVKAQFTRAPHHAMLRTTTAFTMLAARQQGECPAGPREKPRSIFELLPGDTSDDVLAHIRRQAGFVLPAERFTSGESGVWQRGLADLRHDRDGLSRDRTSHARAPAEHAGRPGLMLAATDARISGASSEQIYRFSSPIHAKPDDLARFHGTNERLAVAISRP